MVCERGRKRYTTDRCKWRGQDGILLFVMSDFQIKTFFFPFISIKRDCLSTPSSSSSSSTPSFFFSLIASVIAFFVRLPRSHRSACFRLVPSTNRIENFSLIHFGRRIGLLIFVRSLLDRNSYIFSCIFRSDSLDFALTPLVVVHAADGTSRYTTDVTLLKLNACFNLF